MQLSNLPATKLPIPFAASAGGGYIRTIPQASQIGITDGAASLTDGFVPLNFQPVGSGGVPPDGRDMNGILNEISAWTRWYNAGGLVPYDSSFSTAIGGYPRGAVLTGAASGTVWLNLVDNNTTNPDSGGANWVSFAVAQFIQNGFYNWAGTFGGTVNALTATLSPVPTSIVAGFRVYGKLAGAVTSSTGAVTLNVNGLGAATVINKDGTAIPTGAGVAGEVVCFEFDGANWQLGVPTRAATQLEVNAGLLSSVYVSPATLKQQVPVISRRSSTTQSVPSNVITTLQGAIDLETLVDSTYSAGVWTIGPKDAGSYVLTNYFINGSAPGAACSSFSYIFINGSRYVAQGSGLSGTVNPVASATTMTRLNAGDTVNFAGLQDSGTSQSCIFKSAFLRIGA